MRRKICISLFFLFLNSQGWCQNVKVIPIDSFYLSKGVYKYCLVLDTPVYRIEIYGKAPIVANYAFSNATQFIDFGSIDWAEVKESDTSTNMSKDGQILKNKDMVPFDTLSVVKQL